MSSFDLQREFTSWLEAGEGLPFAGAERARVAVHRNTFVGTLVEALAESFPVTRALAGADFFDAMARERVLAEPPRSPVLTEYAIGFPAFVAAFAPAAPAPVLTEMAQLEALRLRAFHAADARPLGHEDFHRLARDAGLFETTGARLHPAAQWFGARHRLLELWQAHQGIEDPTLVDLSHIEAGRPQDLLVHRPHLQLRMRALPEGALAFLDALAGAHSFAHAFERASATSPSVQPAALFSLLLQEQLVIELSTLPGSTP